MDTDVTGALLAFLLNGMTLTIAVVIFIAAIVWLIAGRKKCHALIKAILLAILVVLILYFAFIIGAAFAAGSSHPPAPPMPMPPSS